MVDAHTLKVLEFGKVLDLLAARARTPLGRERALALAPLADPGEIVERLERVSAFRSILESDGLVSLDGVTDIRAFLKNAEVEGLHLEPLDLLQVAETARAADRAAATLSRYRDRFPLAARAVEGIEPCRALVQAVERSIEPGGQVADRATPRLAEIRRATGRVRTNLRRHLEKHLENTDIADARQEDLVTIRNGRFVIPVKAEQKRRVPGIVHDRSASGATVYVEPIDTVELNNELHELEAEERAEVRRILGTLTGMVAEAAPTLRRNTEILAALDLDFAAARFSADLDGGPPELNTAGRVRIVRGRHPLLEGRATGGEGKAVPLDLEVGTSSRVLVVSGPNMGGKTVALKTIGLTALMAQCGLHVPAASGTDLPVFTRIYADIGDEQSIEDSLSTYSSHLRHLVEILGGADDGTLVLLDELGVGTDPEEGVALGISVLETLAERNARVVATTHHGAFKIFADEHPWMENASLEFDPVTLTPTYRFRMGVPGASRGLDLAGRLGVPGAVLERARSLIGSERLELERMLTDLQTRLTEIEGERDQIARERAELAEKNESLSRRLKGVREEERTLREKAREEASRVVRDARRLVEQTVAEVRTKGADKASIKKARESLAEASQELDRAAPEEVRAEAFVPAVGDEVWIATLGKRGTLVAEVDSSGHVTVQTGKLRLKVPLSTLSRPAGGGAPPETAGRVQYDATPSGATEIDVRGLTAEEALQWIDRFLDEAMLTGLGEVRVIHGKGTGVLKREVEAMLSRDPRVRGFRLGNWNEGGWGATVVTLQ